MSIVYLNGEFVEEKVAKVSINDTGYYYGDGIYEVILFHNGKLIDKDLHLDRMVRSMNLSYFKNTPTKEEILSNILKTIDANKDFLKDSKSFSVYIQMTRGETPRTQSFVNLNLKPNCLIKCNPCTISDEIKKWHCMIADDPRRVKCNIKMTSLLPMVLIKHECELKGFNDVIFFNKNYQSITEGTSFNVFVVDKNNNVITCPEGEQILSGCTRARIIQLLKSAGFNVEERFFSKEELFNAKEVFITSTTKIAVSVVKIDDKVIGDGDVGEITKTVKKLYKEFIEK